MVGQVRLGDRLAQLLDFGIAVLFLAQFALDGLELLAQEIIALILVHLRLDFALDFRADLQHLPFAIQDFQNPRQAALDVDGAKNLLLLGGRERQIRGDQIGQFARLLDVGGGDGQIVGQRGHLDDLDQHCLGVLHHRLRFGVLGRFLGKDHDLRLHIRLFGDALGDANAADAMDKQADRAVGDAKHFQNRGRRARFGQILESLGFVLVAAFGGWLVFFLRRLARKGSEHPVRCDDILDQLPACRVGHQQRRDHERKQDKVVQHQNRQFRGHVGRAAGKAFGVQRIGFRFAHDSSVPWQLKAEKRSERPLNPIPHGC
ncbi:MAG: hypothetical protein BWZ10_00719 [candidate division BRC1 bacterium ADurb.BinA364]|nr:MAG: hypothetical protein BWZ10_00719 [candidate division BRC1 bacterium ADurb.BinA364]